MGRRVRLDRPGYVLELGGGTGSLTQGLLDQGCPPERLLVIEREPALVAVLRRRFANVEIIEGDATRLAELLAERGINQLATVVSSLPIKWFPRAAQAAIVDQSFALLGSGGRLLQLTNAVVSPLPMGPLGLEGEQVARVWRNFLPVQIWSYRRLEAAAGRLSPPMPGAESVPAGSRPSR